MKKIVFVYDHLQTGGIATYLINIFNQLDYSKYSVTFLIKTIKEEVLQNIPNEVKISYLKDLSLFKKLFYYIVYGGLSSSLKLLFKNKYNTYGKHVQNLQIINARFSKEHNEHYDIAIGADLYWPNYYTALRINADRKYLWIHPQYNALGVDADKDIQIFSTVDKIFAVSSHNAEILKSSLGKIEEKIDYLENIICLEKIRSLSKEQLTIEIDESRFNIITVCRIDNTSKRIDRIVKCAKILSNKNINYIWRIVGDGPDYDYIKDLIYNNGLKENIILTGGYMNPFPLVAASNVFVLLSQYEGVPLAVTEAMILGLPVVVSNYESANSQVSKEYGYIVDNDDTVIAEQAADKIIQLSSLPVPRRIYFEKNNSESQDKLNQILGV